MIVAKNNSKNSKNKTKAVIKKHKIDFINFIRFQNTITISIMAGVILFVCLIQGILYAYTRDNLKEMQNNVSAGIFSNMKVFSEDVQNRHWDSLKNDLNSVLENNNEIRDIIVVSKDRNETYSSVVGGKFDFINENNPASLRLFYANDYDVRDYRIVYIPTNDYYVYLLLPKSGYNFEYFVKFSFEFFALIM